MMMWGRLQSRTSGKEVQLSVLSWSEKGRFELCGWLCYNRQEESYALPEYNFAGLDQCTSDCWRCKESCREEWMLWVMKALFFLWLYEFCIILSVSFCIPLYKSYKSVMQETRESFFYLNKSLLLSGIIKKIIYSFYDDCCKITFPTKCTVGYLYDGTNFYSQVPRWPHYLYIV